MSPNIADMPVLPDAPACRGFNSAVFVAPTITTPDGRRIPLGSFRGRTTVASIQGPIQDPVTYSRWFDSLRKGDNVFIRNPRTGRRESLDAEEMKRIVVGNRRWRIVKDKIGNIEEPQWVDFIDSETLKLMKISDLKRETTAELFIRRQLMNEVLRNREREIAIAFANDPELIKRVTGIGLARQKPEE